MNPRISFSQQLDGLREDARYFIQQHVTEKVELIHYDNNYPTFKRWGNDLDVITINKDAEGTIILISSTRAEGRLSDMDTMNLCYLADLISDRQ